MRRPRAGILLGAGLLSAGLWAAGVALAGDAALEAENDRLAGLVLEHLLEGHARVLRVADPIRIAAAPDCGKEVGSVLGAYVATLDTFETLVERDAGFKARVARAAASRFALDDRPRVLVVVPGLPGDTAGLRVGDVITGRDGRALTRRDRLHALELDRDGQRFTLSIERDGRPLELEVGGRLGCSQPAQSWFGNSINAFATRFGKRTGTYVLSGMLAFAPSDDELAIVLGHELAHLILWSGGTRRTEAEADYLGLYLAARAGFDVAAAPAFWERMGRENPFSGIDWGFYAHPTSAARQVELRATVAEIQAKRAAEEPLTVPRAFTGLTRPDASQNLDAATDALQAAALARLQEKRERLLRVHQQLRVGAVALCEDEVSPVLGASVGRRRDVIYGKESDAEKLFGLVDQVQVLVVLPGSPASAGGLAPGDRIVRVNGRSIEKSQDVFAALREAREAAPSLSVERGGETLELRLPRVSGCQHEAMLTMSGSFDVTADRNREELRVPEGLLRFVASDDELAVALAHQLAHHVLDTAQLTDLDDEPAADRLGLQLAAAAGFDVSGAAALLERMAADDPLKLDRDVHVAQPHGDVGARILAVRAELARSP